MGARRDRVGGTALLAAGGWGRLVTEGDPALLPALFLDHLRAGIDALEGCTLDLEDRHELSRLALRLIRLSRKDSQ